MRQKYISDFPLLDRHECISSQPIHRHRPILDVHKLLAFYGAFRMLQGQAAEGAVVLGFPPISAVKAFYYSPAFQAVLTHRLASAECRAFIVEGVATPSVPPG